MLYSVELLSDTDIICHKKNAKTAASFELLILPRTLLTHIGTTINMILAWYMTLLYANPLASFNNCQTY